jgi:hypothetical protein
VRHWFWIFLAFPIVVMAACGEDDGKTPNCPDLPLYDVNNPTSDEIAAREAAEAAGCLTKPGPAPTSTTPAPDSGSVDAASD